MAASTGILKDAEHDQVNISPPNNIQVYQNYDEAEDDDYKPHEFEENWIVSDDEVIK